MGGPREQLVLFLGLFCFQNLDDGGSGAVCSLRLASFAPQQPSIKLLLPLLLVVAAFRVA